MQSALQPDGSVVRIAVEAALAAGKNSPDRLPGLIAIFDQLPKALIDEMKTLSVAQPKITLIGLVSGRYNDIALWPTSTVTAVVNVLKLKGNIVFSADADAVSLFVDAALGYDFVVPSRPSGRQPTAAEINVVRVLFRRLARSLTNVFSLVTDIEFEVGQVGAAGELEPVCGAAAAVLVARLKLEIGEQAGVIEIAIPQEILSPIRSLLVIDPAPEMPGHETLYDDDWSRQLAEELSRAFVSVSAVLSEETMALADVRRFAVGTIVPLSILDTSRARLDFDGGPIFWCELGKRDGNLTLRIEQSCEFDERAGAFFADRDL